MNYWTVHGHASRSICISVAIVSRTDRKRSFDFLLRVLAGAHACTTHSNSSESRNACWRHLLSTPFWRCASPLSGMRVRIRFFIPPNETERRRKGERLVLGWAFPRQVVNFCYSWNSDCFRRHKRTSTTGYWRRIH